MQKSQWGAPIDADRKKAPYTDKQKITKDMSESQKKGAELWNLFIEILQENGLMEERKRGG